MYIHLSHLQERGSHVHTFVTYTGTWVTCTYISHIYIMRWITFTPIMRFFTDKLHIYTYISHICSQINFICRQIVALDTGHTTGPSGKYTHTYIIKCALTNTRSSHIPVFKQVLWTACHMYKRPPLSFIHTYIECSNIHTANMFTHSYLTSVTHKSC